VAGSAGGSSAGGTSGAGAGGAAGDGTSNSDAGLSDANNSVVTCGGVHCPALFDLVATCRPTGTCVRGGAVGNTSTCYNNGVRVHSRVDLVRGLIIEVTKPDGVSPCYSMDVGTATNGGLRPAILQDPQGLEIARGEADPDDGGLVNVTCEGTTVPLQDRRCLADPGIGICPPGPCQ
jgi:hypothetical protein